MVKESSQKRVFTFKPFEELTFSDDGMFQEVLRNPDICAELVERLLHIKVNHVEFPELEKTIAPYYTTKGVRLDVYLKDSDKVIDVELQSYPQKALGKRTRYYNSMIDMDTLMKGQDYLELKDSYILFICKNDPFKNELGNAFGLPCYTFRNVCIEDSTVNLNDNSLKVIYNASAFRKENDEQIRAFLHFICTNEPGKDDFSKRLFEMVEKVKENEDFRRIYAAMNLHDRDITRAAKQEGREEGARENALANARNFLCEGLTSEQIARCCSLSLEDVLRLKAELEACSEK